MTDLRIQSEAHPICDLCGGGGDYIHKQQPDRLFGADGLWNFKKCSDQTCGLVWLDPMPVKEDIGKAYAKYYTHAQTGEMTEPGFARKMYGLAKRGYWANEYGYQISSDSIFLRILGSLLWLFPFRRKAVDEEVRLLHSVTQGRLLDVGCGSGEWLALMSELGWQAEGLDFDQEAVQAGKKRGVNICCGSLEQQNFPKDSFDAVTLNHVIEHLPDPLRTLQECARILKPNGKLILFTPNTASLGHKIFKQNWRGLEPPRHLHIFDPLSMRTLLQSVGFKKVCVRTFNSNYVWHHSYKLSVQQRGGGGSVVVAKAVAFALTLFEQGLLLLNPSAGECLGAQASKS